MTPLRTMLTEGEAALVEWVHRNPGAKADHALAHGTEDQPASNWQRPEALGLIESVGSYKWRPTERLVLAVTEGSAHWQTREVVLDGELAEALIGPPQHDAPTPGGLLDLARRGSVPT